MESFDTIFSGLALSLGAVAFVTAVRLLFDYFIDQGRVPSRRPCESPRVTPIRLRQDYVTEIKSAPGPANPRDLLREKARRSLKGLAFFRARSTEPDSESDAQY